MSIKAQLSCVSLPLWAQIFAAGKNNTLSVNWIVSAISVWLGWLVDANGLGPQEGIVLLGRENAFKVSSSNKAISLINVFLYGVASAKWTHRVFYGRCDWFSDWQQIQTNIQHQQRLSIEKISTGWETLLSSKCSLCRDPGFLLCVGEISCETAPPLIQLSPVSPICTPCFLFTPFWLLYPKMFAYLKS